MSLKKSIFFIFTLCLFFSFFPGQSALAKNVPTSEPAAKAGFLDQLPISNQRLIIGVAGGGESAFGFSDNKLRSYEFFIFSWGKNGLYRAIAPSFLCEFHTLKRTDVQKRVLCN